MRIDIDLTEKEFMEFLKREISDDDIRMMFENANLEKDDRLLLNELEANELLFDEHIYELDVEIFGEIKEITLDLDKKFEQHMEKFVA